MRLDSGAFRLQNLILGQAARFRERLETESLELTSIRNSHQIRHAEVTQEKLENIEHIDYLFHRLFSMIQLILKIKRT